MSCMAILYRAIIEYRALRLNGQLYRSTHHPQVIRYTDPDYVVHLQDAIQNGRPALLENVADELDPGLEPVLLRQTFQHNGSECILLGDQVIEYHRDFKLYIVTELRNPHFSPEIAVKVTLLNFTITQEGLQDQLLGILAAEEKPQLEEMKNKLIVEGADNKRQLKEIEDKILKVLSASQGNILEDETAIQILSSSKILSEEIAAKQKIAGDTEAEIDETRDGYRPVSLHSSCLFFCISELSNIDTMYQFSLPWFVAIYHKSIRTCRRRERLPDRIDDLNAHFTSAIYQQISRSLFQRHALIFSFILCAGIMRGRGQLDEELWDFFLTGGLYEGSGGSPQEHCQPNPAPHWLSRRSWDEIVRASLQLRQAQGLMNSVKENPHHWMEFYNSPIPHRADMPEHFDKLR